MTPPPEESVSASTAPTVEPNSHEEFSRWHQDFASWLFAWVAARCSPNDVDDICQETWLRAWNHRDDIKNRFQDRNVFGWLITTATRVRIDLGRRGGVPGRNAQQFGEDFDPSDPRTVDPVQSVLTIEEDEILAECLSKLPDDQLQLIQCVNSGLAVSTCAKMLGLPTSSAYVQYDQIKSTLKRCADRNPS